MTKRTTPYSICYNKFDVNNLKTEERLSRINFISKGKVVAGRLKRGRPAVLKKQDCNNNKENRNSNLSSFSLSLGGMDSIVNSYPDNDEKFEGSPPSNLFSKFGLRQSTSKQHDIPNSTEGQAVPINKTVSDNTNSADNFNFDFNNDDSDNEDKNKKIVRNNNDPETEPKSSINQKEEGEEDLPDMYLHYASYNYNYNIYF